MVRRPLADLRRITEGHGATINDVVLAACAGGVRRYLRRRGERPIQLKAMVPVNVRSDNGAATLGNRMSFIFTRDEAARPRALPTPERV
jgi:hypothetical protein